MQSTNILQFSYDKFRTFSLLDKLLYTAFTKVNMLHSAINDHLLQEKLSCHVILDTDYQQRPTVFNTAFKDFVTQCLCI